MLIEPTIEFELREHSKCTRKTGSFHEKTENLNNCLKELLLSLMQKNIVGGNNVPCFSPPGPSHLQNLT